jgi:hypothetical protein
MVHLLAPRVDGLLLEAFEFLLLAHVGGEGDDLAAGVGFQEPPDDDRRIQPARIGDNHFFPPVSTLFVPPLLNEEGERVRG